MRAVCRRVLPLCAGVLYRLGREHRVSRVAVCLGSHSGGACRLASLEWHL